MTFEENPPLENRPLGPADDLPDASLVEDLANVTADSSPADLAHPPAPAQQEQAADVIEAEFVDVEVVEATIAEPSLAGVSGLNANDDAAANYLAAPPIPQHLQNISANGGAVGAIVLGVWSLLGSFITSWSVINAMLGLMLGFWGVTSRRPRLAWIGIVLCLISMFLSMIQISGYVGLLLKAS